MNLRTDPVAVVALVLCSTTSVVIFGTIASVGIIEHFRVLVLSVPGVLLAVWSAQRTAGTPPRRGGRPLAMVALLVGLLPAAIVANLMILVAFFTVLSLGMQAD